MQEAENDQQQQFLQEAQPTNQLQVRELKGLNDSVKSDQTGFTGAAGGVGASTATKNNQEQKPKNKWIIVLLMALAIITYIIVICVLLRRPKKGDNPPGPQPFVFSNKYNAVVVKDMQNVVTGYLIYDDGQDKNQQRNQQGLNIANSRFKDNKVIVADPSKIPQGENNKLIRNLTFAFGMLDYKIGYLKLSDSQNDQRYQIPNEVLSRANINGKMRLEQLGFQLWASPFQFQFSDLNNPQNTLLHTRDSNLQFMDKYIQMDFQLPTQRLFGFGERTREFGLGEGAWTMWAQQQERNASYDDGTGGKNSYGVHPFILIQTSKKTEFIGMFFKSSNAMSPVINFKPSGGSTLSFITTGGILEVYFFIKGSAKAIIQQYHNVIGSPNLSPFWAMGWHQASLRYTNQSIVEDAIQKYQEAKIPLESIGLDMGYMVSAEDFTVNNTVFPDFQGLVYNLHQNNQHIIVTLEAGLSASYAEDIYFKMAQQYDALIKSNLTNKALYQYTWSGLTVFLDWFHNSSSIVWSNGLFDLLQKVQYDGLSLDMNEATGFYQGEKIYQMAQDQQGKEQNRQFKQFETKTLEQLKRRFLQDETSFEKELKDDISNWYASFSNQSTNSTYNLPFIPGYYDNDRGVFKRFDESSISLNATHPSNNLTEFDTHNLFGLMMAKRTFEFLTNTSKSTYNSTIAYNQSDRRPFVLSRSSFSSSGKYSSHSLGYNNRSWDAMNYSISGIMNMNMFGMPHSGADVCGSNGGSHLDSEICARWVQLATFYPLARANQQQFMFPNESLGRDQSEIYNLEQPYRDMAREAMFQRYSYMRHMYTCLFEISQWGGTCFDPLFYYYPEDDITFSQIESSFMMTSALKVSPILLPSAFPNITTFKSYFPAGKWVNLDDFSVVNTTGGGAWVDLQKQNTVNVHLREGQIVVQQADPLKQFNSTQDYIDKVPITLIANRDANGQAGGSLFLDSGDSRQEISNNSYEYHQLQLQAKTLHRINSQGTQYSRNNSLYMVIIANAADLSDTKFACVMHNDLSIEYASYEYIASKQSLVLTMPNGGVNISSIRQINYGNATDLNLCEPTTYQYKAAADQILDLTKSSAGVVLEHVAGILPKLMLNVTLQNYGSTILNVLWTFNNSTNASHVPFEVPVNLVGGLPNKTSDEPLSNYISYQANPFSLAVKTHSNSIEVQVLNITGMLLDSYLNVIQATLNTRSGSDFKGIFGLGDRISDNLFYPDGVYSLWAREASSPVENGKAPGNNFYGAHPFYAFQVNPAVWAGVFTKLAAAQDWWVKNDAAAGKININTMANGGMADIFIILGDSPKSVIKGYWKIIGEPVFTPQFALGWNQCKWGYENTQALRDVVSNYTFYDIPLDTQWSDIDYMSSYWDFTYDKQRYADLPAFVDELHNKSMHYVPIIDAGIAKRAPGLYMSYDFGHQQDVFIKIKDNQELIGKVWPADAVFPDFFNQKAVSWWKDSLTNMWNDIKFDGLWQDMNEVSDKCNGVCYKEQQPDSPVKYNFKYLATGRDIELSSMPLDAYHSNGMMQLDTHGLFGTQQVKASHEWFNTYPSPHRTFIISRSTFAGAGKFTSRWLGDNESKVDHMKYSVLGTMMSNMYGIPLVGADICGFSGDTTPELCARWHVVGAFYPFSRNHNNWMSLPQEPYQFNTTYYEHNVTYMEIMRTAIKTKYNLIRYYYTQMYYLSFPDQPEYGAVTQNNGTSIYQPMFFEFPDDPLCYGDVHNNVMLGSALKLSVRSDALNQNYTDFYFPAGTWCNIFNTSEPCIVALNGVTKTLRTKAYDFYVHLREGHVVPLQDSFANNITNTAQLQNKSVDFHALPKTNQDGFSWSAEGLYYNDDGLVLNPAGFSNQYKLRVQGNASSSNFNLTIDSLSNATNLTNATTNCSAVNRNDYLGSIYIYNAANRGLNTNYTVTITYRNGTTQSVGAASFDEVSQRVVYQNKDAYDLCMTIIEKFDFAPAA